MPDRVSPANSRAPVNPEAVIEILSNLVEGGHFNRHIRLSIFELWALATAWCDTSVTRRELRATLGAAGLMAGDRGAGYATYDLVKAINEGGSLISLLARVQERDGAALDRLMKAQREQETGLGYKPRLEGQTNDHYPDAKASNLDAHEE